MSETRQKEYFSIKYFFAGEEEKIPPILDSYAQNNVDLTDVNRVLELYNVKVVLTEAKYINGWSDEKYNKYKSIVQKVDDDVKSFFLKITEETIVSVFKNCNVVFWDDFWHFFYRYNVFEKISEAQFKRVIEGLRMSPDKLLENKALVQHFDNQVAEMLRQPEFGARFIVDYYIRADEKKRRYYLPNSLTAEDKYNVVKEYINGDDVNAKMLDLIINGKSKNQKEFKIDDRLRYHAKLRFKRFWEENTSPVVNHGIEIAVSFAPDNPDFDIVFMENSLSAKYNSNWIKDNLDYPTLLNNFIYLFFYTDGYMRCNLTSRKLRQVALENLFLTQGNGIYQRSHSFQLLNSLANAQMFSYINILKGFDIYLEEIIKWFFEEYLADEFYVNGFKCLMPERTDSSLSKYERVATVMDGITKQFKLYCEEGEIDRGLYEMISGLVKYKDIPSLIHNKYAYPDSQSVEREMYDLFSDQSMLSYTDRTKGSYNSFFELLVNEKVNVDEVMVYNRDEIEWLIGRNTISNEGGYYTVNMERAWILNEFYRKGVICLQYRKSKILKSLIDNGEVTTGSTLLSKPEWEYFNYVLNKAEFSNGLDLRNRYIHDTNSLDEKQQQHDYIVLLKMFTILVIKINEEFCLKEKNSKSEMDYYEVNHCSD